jgi:uncharacterized protein
MQRFMAFGAVLLACTILAAQEPAPPQALRYIRATGEGAVQVNPDQATVTIGVVSQAHTASAAAADNAKQLTAVLHRLRQDLGAGSQIKTEGYSLSPNYRYPQPPETGSPSITGYTASNLVQVTVDDVNQVGKVIDAAAQTGANDIRNVSFGLKDEQAARLQALARAARNARAEAEEIASALGVRVVRLHSAETSSGVVIPSGPMMARARVETPIQPGTVDIRATVTVTLEVAP